MIPAFPHEQAAMFEPSTVALHGVYQNQYQGGGYVAVLGGGTIGMFTMQWTKIFGSKKVVVFDISEERLELAKRLGADEVINTTEENYMEKAMAITEGKGYDYVFETAGQVPTLKNSRALRNTPCRRDIYTGSVGEDEPQGILSDRFLDVLQRAVPGQRVEADGPHYFATGQLKFDPGFILRKCP